MNRIVYLAAFLAACGGSEPETTSFCPLPSEQSAFQACRTAAYVGPNNSVTVEITGKVSGNDTFARYVSIRIDGDGYQGVYISRLGEFRIQQTVTAETFGKPKWVDIEFASIETFPGASSKITDVTLTVTSNPR